MEEKHLDKSWKLCYTYDNLSRVTTKTIRKASDNSVISTETFTYDAAGNITDAPDSCFAYDTNNRLTVFCGQNVSYDLDGNMLSNGSLSCTYDSANRLVSAGGHTYTYNAEDIRIRNLCSDADTTYTYNTNAKLSQLLWKNTNGFATKYVYGRGLICEEKCGEVKIYHFDKRGSTVALTDVHGNITDTFKYDTYGKLIERTGESFIIFGYNGRDGVITDKNGLIYMRARYYSPEMKRFINADIVRGEITNAVTLNRYAYANANPVSNVDPLGLWSWSEAWNGLTNWVDDTAKDVTNWASSKYTEAKEWATSTVSSAIDSAKGILTNPQNETERAIATTLDLAITVGAALVAADAGAKAFCQTTASSVVSSAGIGAGVGAGVGGGKGAAIGAIAGAGVGLVTGIVNGTISGIIKGAATFGAVNNTVNALYYNYISDGESELTPTSYSDGGGAKYINRWDRLDYTKKETSEQYFNSNSWRYYSEYNVHMYGWLATSWALDYNISLLSEIAGRSQSAEVEKDKWDERPLIQIGTVIAGLLGI